MKSLYSFLTVFLSFSFLQVQAQETSPFGKWILGGSFNFSTSENLPFGSSLILIDGAIIGGADPKATSFSLSPYIGKEVSAHWTLALSGNIGTGRGESTYVSEFNGQAVISEVERKSGSYGIGLLGRYNVNPQNQLNFFLQPFGTYSHTSQDTYVNGEFSGETIRKSLQMGIGAGLSYTINNHWRALVSFGNLSYFTGKEAIGNFDEKFNRLEADFGLRPLALGFEIRL